MSSGWIKLHRSMFDNELWMAEPFTKGQAWIDLIGNANHKPASVWIRGIELEVKRGQLAWSELTMAKRWKWSRGKIRRYLGMLEKKQMIVQQTNKITSIVTICNYLSYQDLKTLESTSYRTTNRTTDEQQTDNRRYTNKNDKKNKNDKNTNIIPMASHSIEYVAAGEYFLPTNRYETQRETFPVTKDQIDNWAKLYPNVEVDSEIRKMIGWLDGNPSKRKTMQGMKRFANNWLSKAQDQPTKKDRSILGETEW